MELNCDEFQRLREKLLKGDLNITEQQIKQLEEHYAACPCQREIFEQGVSRLMEDIRMGD